MISGLNHIAVSCTDFDKSLQFYTEVIGLDILNNQGEISPYEKKDTLLALNQVRTKTAMLGNDSFRIELIQFIEPVDPSDLPPKINRIGFSHIALNVDDFDTEYARFKALGATFSSEPIEFGPLKVVYAHDPDKNVIELMGQ